MKCSGLPEAWTILMWNHGDLNKAGEEMGWSKDQKVGGKEVKEAGEIEE